MPVTPSSIPRLWKLARVDYDRVRQRPVLLYPEGAILLNQTGAEILKLCDGRRTVEEIGRDLGERYRAHVTGDVAEYLGRLADQGFVFMEDHQA